jgi:hypothetical protein
MKLKVAGRTALHVHIEDDSPLNRSVALVPINNYVAKSEEQHVKEAIETANLFAAAPELLEACKEAFNTFACDDVRRVLPNSYDIACRKIQQAIAKATK